MSKRNKDKKHKKFKKLPPYEKDAFIEVLVVDKDVRGRGLGTTLLRLGCQEAKRRAMSRVFATCWSRNLSVIEANKKAGLKVSIWTLQKLII